jgi:hypothetical protein
MKAGSPQSDAFRCWVLHQKRLRKKHQKWRFENDLTSKNGDLTSKNAGLNMVFNFPEYGDT